MPQLLALIFEYSYIHALKTNIYLIQKKITQGEVYSTTDTSNV